MSRDSCDKPTGGIYMPPSPAGEAPHPPSPPSAKPLGPVRQAPPCQSIAATYEAATWPLTARDGPFSPLPRARVRAY